MTTKREKRINRHKKLRHKVTGTAERPRLAVFRSNRFISAQLIDDTAGKTLAAVHDIKKNAEAAGEKIAGEAKAKKITAVVFDRAGFLYAGRVKAFAEAARKGGLEF